VLSQWLYYFLHYDLERLIGFAGGTAQKNLLLRDLRAFSIALQPLPTQHKIASILSAYDDLIENNTRRITILEAMAQAIYREWFVEFRFPGHEKVKLVDSPLGKIPEGWEITPLKRITTKIGSGATPRGGKEAYKSSGITLIRSLNIYDYHFDHDGLAYIDDDQAAQLDNVVVEKRDILLNITGASVARCCMVPSYFLPARVNQHVAIIRVNTEACDPFYVLNTINNERHKRQILALAQGGATREALTKDTISNYEIVLPPLKIVKEYSEVVTALFDQRELLQRKNNCLRTTRDLLLPKLISGQLDVEDLDIETGETVTMTE
jgi:type I restriction enzyme S subunit